jgi:hypothetical protein
VAGEREQGAGPAQLAGVGQQVRAPADRHHPQQLDAAEPACGACHRDRRDHTGAADQAERGSADVPGEPAADRAAHLEHVADLGHPGQELRHLALRKLLDEELHEGVVVVGGDGVRALRRVVVGSAETDQVVLPGTVPLAVVDVHPEPYRGRGRQLLLDDRPGGPCRGRRLHVVDGTHGSPW